MEAVPLKGSYHFVLVRPPVGISTADVYRRVVPPDEPRPIGPILEALSHGGFAELGRSLFNRLQPVAEALRPELVRVKDALASLGPLLNGFLMSGSGSAYFGLCPDSAAASRAAEILKPLGLGWVRVVTCPPKQQTPRKGVPAVEITEVRIKLMEDNSGSNERLQAFCSITFDDMFVIRDLKIIEGAKGFFVAMPSRKLTDRCHNCGTKNHLRSRFCNQCGCRLDENRALRDADGRAKLHADIAHPINSMCREKIQGAVLSSYAEELERSKMPGYVSRYDEYEADEFDLQYEGQAAAPDGGRQRASIAARTATRPHPACSRKPVGVARPPRRFPQGERIRGDRLRTPPPSRRVVLVRQWSLNRPSSVSPRCFIFTARFLLGSRCHSHPQPLTDRLLFDPAHRGFDPMGRVGFCAARRGPERRRRANLSGQNEASPPEPGQGRGPRKADKVSTGRSVWRARTMQVARITAIVYIGITTVFFSLQTRIIFPAPAPRGSRSQKSARGRVPSS